jgi:hypothetical protein
MTFAGVWMGVSAALFAPGYEQLWVRNEVEDGGGVSRVGSIEYDDDEEEDEDMAADVDEEDGGSDVVAPLLLLLLLFNLVLTVLFSES